jgi:addiction module HigA family antidote
MFAALDPCCFATKNLNMHKPPHPGEFIRSVYMEPFGISVRKLATRLAVSPSTLSRLLRGDSGVSPEMALRLSRVIGRSPESWLSMQDAHDLWMVRRSVDIDQLQPFDFEVA